MFLILLAVSILVQRVPGSFAGQASAPRHRDRGRRGSPGVFDRSGPHGIGVVDWAGGDLSRGLAGAVWLVFRANGCPFSLLPAAHPGAFRRRCALWRTVPDGL